MALFPEAGQFLWRGYTSLLRGTAFYPKIKYAGLFSLISWFFPGYGLDAAKQMEHCVDEMGSLAEFLPYNYIQKNTEIILMKRLDTPFKKSAVKLNLEADCKRTRICLKKWRCVNEN